MLQFQSQPGSLFVLPLDLGSLYTKKKTDSLPANHSVYIYKIRKGWGKQTIVKNVEIRLKGLNCQYFQHLVVQIRSQSKRAQRQPVGELGTNPSYSLGGDTSGISKKNKKTHNIKTPGPNSDETAAELSTFLMIVTVKNLNGLPQLSMYFSRLRDMDEKQRA